MTRVQELGRLCRYPTIDSRERLVSSSSSSADFERQLEAAFSFAASSPHGSPVRLNIHICKQIALSSSEAAQNVYAYEDWMRSSRARADSPDHAAKLAELVQALVVEVCVCSNKILCRKLCHVHHMTAVCP